MYVLVLLPRAMLCLAAQSCQTLCTLMDCSPPGSSVHGDSPGKKTGVGCYFLLQGNLPDPGIEPRSRVSPALQTDSLPLSHLGSPSSVPLFVNTFSLSTGCPSVLSQVPFTVQKAFTFNSVPFGYFCFYFPCRKTQDQKGTAKN